MGFRRILLAGLGFLFVFGFGAGFWAAAERGLWASALAALLLAFAAAAPTLARLRLQPGAHRPELVAAGGDPVQDRRMAHLLDQAPAPLLMDTPQGGLLAVNRAARALFETGGRVTAPPALSEAMHHLRAGERRVVRLGADKARAYALTCAEAAGPDGLTRLISLTDIEAELSARETATLKQTLDVLSHEIMNSLTPVTSLAQTASGLLAEGDHEAASRALMTLERRAGGLLRFVDSYRALARLPEPDVRECQLGVLIEDAARLFQERWSGEGVILETGPALPGEVSLDPDLMGQALINLLTNAAEAALPDASPDRPARVRLEAHADDSGAMAIRISDNGPGPGALSPGAMLKPFFSTKPGGAGIGLNLVHQVVQGHGADLMIEAPGLEGRGLTVTLRLPAR